jgi:hypothetical protein
MDHVGSRCAIMDHSRSSCAIIDHSRSLCAIVDHTLSSYAFAADGWRVQHLGEKCSQSG